MPNFGRRLATFALVVLLGACESMPSNPFSTAPDPSPAEAQASEKLNTAEMLKSADATLARFVDNKAWSGLSNALGGARGVIVVPVLRKGGLIVGYQSGSGVLLARHGAAWSDPVFVGLSTGSIGTQIGYEQSESILLIMADGGVTKLVSGAMSLGTSGGFALGSLGVGGGGSGGASSGLNVLSARLSGGLFAGGGIDSGNVTIDVGATKSLLGANADPDRIVTVPGRNAASQTLRDRLEHATERAWRE